MPVTTMPLGRPATYADLLALPEAVHAEILDGEIVVSAAPTPRHNRMAGRLCDDLDRAGEPHGYGAVTDVDVQWPDGQVTRPDVVVLTLAAVEADSGPVTEAPLVVVEVLSPDSAGRDLVKKPRIAAASGVAEYWVVDAGTSEVFRHRAEGGRYEVETYGPGAEVAVRTLPFPYTLRPAVLQRRPTS